MIDPTKPVTEGMVSDAIESAANGEFTIPGFGGSEFQDVLMQLSKGDIEPSDAYEYAEEHILND